MTIRTHSQKMAEAACKAVSKAKKDTEAFEKYSSFAREFPTLIHTSGLAQSVAFGNAKNKSYIRDLGTVLAAMAALTPNQDLSRDAQTSGVSAYIRLSRSALLAAGWIKRFAEAEKPEATNA